MPDRDVIYVPVDPEAYGAGLALGCLLQYWPYVLGSILLMALCGSCYVGVHNAGDAVAQWNYERVSAEQTRVALPTETARMSQLNLEVNRLKKQKTIVIHYNDTRKWGQNVWGIEVGAVNFGDDGIQVSLRSFGLDGYADPGGIRGAVKYSCIYWKGEGSEGGDEMGHDNGIWYRKPTSVQITQTGDDFNGYIVFPYTIITQGASRKSHTTVYYFRFGCSGRFFEDGSPGELNLFEIGT